MKISLKWLGIIIGLLLTVGITFEYYSRWRLEKALYENKTYVTVNGKKLYYTKKDAGKHTVIFLSGMGSNHLIWQEMQEDLSADAVTLSYDRNGLFLSERSDIPITNDALSDELEQLLEKIHCPKPYIVVAHSMAAIYGRPFIHNHQQDIAGIVLAEAAHPHQLKKASRELLDTRFIPSKNFLTLLINSGIYRTLFSFTPVSPEIPMNHRLQKLERDFFYRSYETMLDEVANDSLNFADAEQYTSFGDIPLTVILGTSAIRYAGIKEEKIAEEYKHLTDSLAQDMLHLSTNSRLVEAPRSGHVFQVYDGALVNAEIRKLLYSAKD